MSTGILFYIVPYLIGSVPFGFLLTKIFIKQDIRTIGSGNIGATNVLRTGNRILALFVLILDATKGSFLIFYLTGFQNFSIPDFSQRELLFSPNILHFLSLVLGLFAILGHCFPIWLKFKGGKGVATALGVLLAAVPYAGLAACLTWIITAKITKISSLSALVALTVAPIVTFFIYGSAPALICTLITLLVWWRHKDNIKRLLNGTEPKIGQKKKDADAPPVSE